VIENLSRGIEVHGMLFDVSAGLNGIPFDFHTPMLYGIAVARHRRSPARRRALAVEIEEPRRRVPPRRYRRLQRRSLAYVGSHMPVSALIGLCGLLAGRAKSKSFAVGTPTPYV
jgi:hypothetical protein